jgi:hypothetical protein
MIVDDFAFPPPPTFLAPAYALDELEHSGSSIAVIEATGEILWVNRQWRRFAVENGGGPWRDEKRSYFEGITPPLRAYYRSLFQNALATGQPFDQEYECSSPKDARHFHLRILPVDQRALLLEHSLVVTHPHPGDAVAEPRATERYAGPVGVILQCSNCRRVRRPGTRAWDWVPALVAEPASNVSHGICPSCVGFYWGRVRKKAK